MFGLGRKAKLEKLARMRSACDAGKRIAELSLRAQGLVPIIGSLSPNSGRWRKAAVELCAIAKEIADLLPALEGLEECASVLSAARSSIAVMRKMCPVESELAGL